MNQHITLLQQNKLLLRLTLLKDKSIIRKKAESSDFKLFQSKIVSIGNMPQSDKEILINDMEDMN